MMQEVEHVFTQIDEDVKNNAIVLYMKGTKLMPQCGFSSRVVDILNELGADYITRDVLQDDLLRMAIKEYSEWPTLPQLYINGEFIGGCDIVTELHKSGELKTMIESM